MSRFGFIIFEHAHDWKFTFLLNKNICCGTQKNRLDEQPKQMFRLNG